MGNKRRGIEDERRRMRGKDDWELDGRTEEEKGILRRRIRRAEVQNRKE